MNKLTGRLIEDAAVLSTHVSSTAKVNILNSKITAQRLLLSSVSVPQSSSLFSVNISGVLSAAGIANTPQTDLLSEGWYSGSVSGPNDVRKVLVRIAGTNKPLNDDAMDEVYGVLTFNSTPKLTLYKSTDGNVWTTNRVDIVIDIYFVAMSGINSLSSSALVDQAVSGVIDGGRLLTLATHLDGLGVKHQESEVGVLGAFDGTTIDSGSTIKQALQALETGIEQSTFSDGSIGTAKFADGAITSIKLNDAVVDNTTIEFSTPDRELQVKDASITAAHLASETIRNADITDIDPSKLITGESGKTLSQKLVEIVNPVEVSSAEIVSGAATALRSYSPVDMKSAIVQYTTPTRYQKFVIDNDMLQSMTAYLDYSAVGDAEVFFGGLKQNVNATIVDDTDITLFNSNSLHWNPAVMTPGMSELVFGDELEIFYHGFERNSFASSVVSGPEYPTAGPHSFPVTWSIGDKVVTIAVSTVSFGSGETTISIPAQSLYTSTDGLMAFSINNTPITVKSLTRNGTTGEVSEVIIDGDITGTYSVSDTFRFTYTAVMAHLDPLVFPSGYSDALGVVTFKKDGTTALPVNPAAPYVAGDYDIELRPSNATLMSGVITVLFSQVPNTLAYVVSNYPSSGEKRGIDLVAPVYFGDTISGSTFASTHTRVEVTTPDYLTGATAFEVLSDTLENGGTPIALYTGTVVVDTVNVFVVDSSYGNLTSTLIATTPIRWIRASSQAYPVLWNDPILGTVLDYSLFTNGFFAVGQPVTLCYS